jgi:lipopolysaccharide transport system permease protein
MSVSLPLPIDRRFAAREATLELAGDRSAATQRALAVQDMIEGARLWRLATTLGWLDIKLRYRGSLLGPFWLTISTAVMVAALGVLYSTLFHIDVHDYLPFLTLSQVLWGFISQVVADGGVCFTSSESLIRSVRMPLTVHALRVLVRNLLVLGHNVIVVVGVDLIFAVWPGSTMLLAVPGLMLWLVDAFAIVILLGAIGARFRDIPPIVASIMQIAFFVTPIIWKPEQLGAHVWVLPFNPLFSILEVVRAPLLGEVPASLTWIMAMAYSLLLCGLTWWLAVRARGRVAYWL